MDRLTREHLTTLNARAADDDDEEQGPLSRPDGALDKQLIDARTLLVHGAVTDKLAAYCATRLMVMEKEDPERPITVMINSPGGSADSGFAIYDMLRFVRAPVITVVNGLCASAGILIQLATAKERRFSTPESRFLIHQPSTAGFGTASDLDITAREVLKLRQRYNRIISDATGQDPERVLEDARRDFWLNADEAKEYGLISKVVVSRSELD
ncbi:MAG: ATP-dependent Clp protease proteolytic subunit [Planctomycetota bacterium]